MQTTAEAVDLSSAGLNRARDLVAGAVARGKIAGAVTLVARHGQVVQLECLGMADIEAGRPMQPDTIFRIASMTKPVVSVGAMMLVEDGRLRLDDPIARYIPEFADVNAFAGVDGEQPIFAPLERPITVRDLLMHTSGIAGDAPHPLLNAAYDEPEGLYSRPLADFVRFLAARPLAHQPGRAWNYGQSHAVLGHVIERAAGVPLDDYLEAAIFSPLGMVDSGFYVPPDKIDRLAAVYEPGDGLRLVDAPATSKFARRPTLLGGGGGLVSTTLDYLRFCRMLLGRGELDGIRLLTPETVDQMTRNHLPADIYPIRFGDLVSDGEGYGLGFGVIVEPALTSEAGSEGTYHWGGMWNTAFWIDPARRMIGIFMIQTEPFTFDGLKRDFRALVYDALID